VDQYLVEVYQPRAGASVAAARARSAAEAVSCAATRVRYVRSIFVPEDETCFHIFESSSKDAVLATIERAALRFARIAEAVSMTGTRRNQGNGGIEQMLRGPGHGSRATTNGRE
jgi:hypothetical protein